MTFPFTYSIGANDKLILNRTIKSIELRRKKLSEARQALYRAGQQKLREKITGDRNKRIRDHMKEVPQVNKQRKCCTLTMYALGKKGWVIPSSLNVVIKLYLLMFGTTLYFYVPR